MVSWLPWPVIRERNFVKEHFIFVGKQAVRMVLLVFFVSLAAFVLVSVSPLDPLQANVGQAALGSMSQEQIAKLQTYWGVDEPPVERFLAWAGDFFRGDMGLSLLYRQPVAKVIGVKLANSLWLMAIAWILSGAVGFVLGILAGLREGSLLSIYCLLSPSITKGFPNR